MNMKKAPTAALCLGLSLLLFAAGCQGQQGGQPESRASSGESSSQTASVDENAGKELTVRFEAGENGGFVTDETTTEYPVGCDGFSYEDQGDQTMEVAFQTDFSGNILATYAGNIDNPGDMLVFDKIQASREGKYKLSIHYTSDSIGNTHSLYVNGEKQQTVVYPSTGMWNAFPDDALVTVTVFLKEGENSIRLGKGEDDIGYAQIAGLILKDQTVSQEPLEETVVYKYRVEEVPVPEGDAGYCFVKWVKNGGEEAVDPANEVITEDTVFTAVFAQDADNNGVPDQQEASYTVTYQTDGNGTLTRGEPTAYPVENAVITSDFENIGTGVYYCEQEDFQKYGYVYNIDAPNDKIEFQNVTVPADGEYRLVIPYCSNSNMSNTLTLLANGQVQGKLAFGTTGAWSIFSKENVLETKVALKAGDNTIAIMRSEDDTGACMVADLSLYVDREAESFTEQVKSGERPENVPEPVPAEGWRFQQWEAADGQRANPDREAVSGDVTYTAAFRQ